MKTLLVSSLLTLATNGLFSAYGHATMWDADFDRLAIEAEARMRLNAETTCRGRGGHAVQKSPTYFRGGAYFKDATATFFCG